MTRFYPNRRRKQRSGFTLLETILAVALSALLIGLIASSVRVYSKLVSDRRADVANAQTARVVLQRIANDIRATYFAEDEEEGGDGISLDDLDSLGGGGTTGDLGGAGATDTGSEQMSVDTTADLTSATVQPMPGLYGNPLELQIDVWGHYMHPVKYDSLTAAGIDPQSANLWSDPKVITYYVRSADASELAGTPLEPLGEDAQEPRSVLVRRVQSRAAATFAAEGGSVDVQGGEQILTDQVLSVTFSYFDGYDWVDNWDSSLDGGLPLAVRIEATIVDGPATTATDSETTTDNLYRVTVNLPTAELAEDTSTMGL